jgi:mannose-6-phosphate isomerase-like protein (cupin superfamily)
VPDLLLEVKSMPSRSFRKPIPAAWCRRIFALAGLTAATAGIGFGTSSAAGSPHEQQATPGAKPRGGYVLERDAEIAREEPGTHKGGGQTIGYSFFKDVPNLALVFRKRTFKPGSAIGYHEQKEDEIYYVLSGRGLMTVDGKEMPVGPGDAILTRPGSSHGLKQVGPEDLVIMINYLQPPAR